MIDVVGIIVALLMGAGVAVAGGGALFAWFVAGAFLIQVIAFIPSYLKRTEHYYDLVGACSYVFLTLLVLIFAGRFDDRSLLLAGLVCCWAIRLGSFLFFRVRQVGEDGRFSELKQSFSRFLMAWVVQGLWITMTAGAAIAAITSNIEVPLGLLGYSGLALFAFGFFVEWLADEQKRCHRLNPANEGRFIQSGLWNYSRHPNYCGEIILWIGVALIAYPQLQGLQLMTLISPAFVYILLTRISGIPILERRADERWGSDPEYQAYKKRTPVLFVRSGD